MKSRKLQNIIFCIFYFLLFNISSCREEIIPPNNPVGNVNEPVKNNSFNNYIFSIEADNVSYNVIDATDFNYGSTSIYFKITNYKSGYVLIKLLNSKYQSLYSKVLDQNYDGNYISVDNVIPDYVEFSFSYFSGNLRVELHRYL